MPNNRSNMKIRLLKDVIHNNNNNFVLSDADDFEHDHVEPPPGMTKCCFPEGCSGPFIDPSGPCDAIKVICNNDQCTEGKWMHSKCFEIWEESVLNYLRTCGRARSWNEKQCLQNLWTKKGYDLAYKACSCKCKRGRLRKDLYYVKPGAETKVKRKAKKKGEKQNLLNNQNNINILNNTKQDPAVIGGHLRQLRISPSEDNGIFLTKHVQSLPVNVKVIKNIKKVKVNDIHTSYDDIERKALMADNSSIDDIKRMRNCNGSMKSTNGPDTNIANDSFKAKITTSPESPLRIVTAMSAMKPIGKKNCAFLNCSDMSSFGTSPRRKPNRYQIKINDEDICGNDEIRSFVTSHLASFNVTTIECVLCGVVLPVFDSYPLIDGTFFLSPQAYSDNVLLLASNSQVRYLNAVCTNCLEGWTDVRCCACKRKWDSSALRVGTMYSYDIFAALPCCQKRLSCKACNGAIIDISCRLPFFSEYSCAIECPYCKVKDTHFVRPLSKTFKVKRCKSVSVLK